MIKELPDSYLSLVSQSRNERNNGERIGMKIQNGFMDN